MMYNRKLGFCLISEHCCVVLVLIHKSFLTASCSAMYSLNSADNKAVAHHHTSYPEPHHTSPPSG